MLTTIRNANVALTGAAGGIGKALCESLARRGAKIWALDLNEEKLKELSEFMSRQGFRINTVAVDVSNEKAVCSTRDFILEKADCIDIWINNAGLPGVGGFNDLSSEEFDRVIQVNLNGVVFGTRASLQVMEKRGKGCIVNIASVAGHLPAPFMAAYNTSKHAVVGFTRSLRAELRVRLSPIKLLLVCPGFVDTPLLLNEGKKLRFPDWMRWILASSQTVAETTTKAIEKGRLETCPTLNGKIILGVGKYFPAFTARCARVLLAKTPFDVLKPYREGEAN